MQDQPGRRVLEGGEVVTSLDEGLRALVAELVRAEVDKRVAELRQPAEFLSPQAAGQLAGVADGTVRRWIREGRLAGHRAGRVLRVRRADLERLLRDGGDASPEDLARRDFG